MRFLAAVAVLLALPRIALAAEDGAAAYLERGLGARWLGLGGAARAAVGDVHAGFWNPAGLTRQGPVAWQVGSMLSHGEFGRSTLSLSGSDLTDRAGAFGLTWMRQTISGLERVDEAGTVTGTESSAEDALLISYGGSLLYQARAGFTVKVLRQQLLGFAATGVAVDAGLLLQPRLEQEFYAALTVANLASTFKWETGARNSLRRGVAAAVAWWTFSRRLLVAADVVSLPDPAGVDLHVGAEVWPYREAAVRAGLDDGRPAGGATYFWKPYELDYAFTWDESRLGNVHQVSLVLHF